MNRLSERHFPTKTRLTSKPASPLTRVQVALGVGGGAADAKRVERIKDLVRTSPLGRKMIELLDAHGISISMMPRDEADVGTTEIRDRFDQKFPWILRERTLSIRLNRGASDACLAGALAHQAFNSLKGLTDRVDPSSGDRDFYVGHGLDQESGAFVAQFFIWQSIAKTNPELRQEPEFQNLSALFDQATSQSTGETQALRVFKGLVEEDLRAETRYELKTLFGDEWDEWNAEDGVPEK